MKTLAQRRQKAVHLTKRAGRLLKAPMKFVQQRWAKSDRRRRQVEANPDGNGFVSPVHCALATEDQPARTMSATPNLNMFLRRCFGVNSERFPRNLRWEWERSRILPTVLIISVVALLLTVVIVGLRFRIGRDATREETPLARFDVRRD